MTKRGQFFILTAVIISIFLFALSSISNYYQEETEISNFNDLANNYVLESKNVINYAILNDEVLIINDTDNPNYPGLLTQYTRNFINYARTKNPNLGLVFVFSNQSVQGTTGKTVIENYLKEEPILYDTGEGENILFSSDELAINQISLQIGGEEFKKSVPTEISTFSPSYFMASDSVLGFVKLDIAGIPYVFETQPGQIDFKVILKSTKLDTDEPNRTEICVSGDVGGEYGELC